jgi:hypothetical protein
MEFSIDAFQFQWSDMAGQFFWPRRSNANTKEEAYFLSKDKNKKPVHRGEPPVSLGWRAHKMNRWYRLLESSSSSMQAATPI